MNYYIRNVRLLYIWLMFVTSLAGCSNKPSRIEPPALDADEVGRQAIELYDSDGSGALSAEELESCPALKSVLNKYDGNSDGELSADEIAGHIRGWTSTTVGLTGASFDLQWNGRPLSGALVELSPEPFLGPSIKPATGNSGPSGRVTPSLSSEDLPEGVRGAMHYGLYKVRVTHPEVQIPSRYNAQTTLGIEVPPHFDHYNPPSYNLTPK